ncbi:MAG: hypothetical protein ACK5SX_04960 [Sandaracinobacter sp.]
MRELTMDEIGNVSGGWIWPVFGAVSGDLDAYGDYNQDGHMSTSDWIGVAGRAGLGALGGGLAGKVIGKGAGAIGKGIGKGAGGKGGGGGGGGKAKNAKKKKLK